MRTVPTVPNVSVVQIVQASALSRLREQPVLGDKFDHGVIEWSGLHDRTGIGAIRNRQLLTMSGQQS
jgi:hypothetical protein